VAEAIAVYKAGADYIGAGACFGSVTKSDTVPLSYAELCAICRAVPIPVVAIGGINAGNVSQLSGSGVAGAAVVSAIFGADDAESAAAALRHKLELITQEADSAKMHLEKVYQAQRIKAAIFDMDGTILDSMPMWEHLASDYVRSLGAVPDDDLDIRIKTMTIYEAADYVKENYGLAKSSEEIVADINSMVAEEYGQRLVLKPGVYDFLLSLKNSGVKLALATATEYNLAKSAMMRLGLYDDGRDNILDEICTCSMAGQGKNKPDVYFMTCNRLGVKKDDVIIYEDSLFAMQTAKRAGFKVAAVFDSAERENWCSICETADYRISFI
jgi:beta-phosphoglucomutase-like phosphatase (HAD superfamily)